MLDTGKQTCLAELNTESARLNRTPNDTEYGAHMTSNTTGAEGGCTCGSVRYRLLANPLIVHCCHCRWCQRETGTAFALNALIETSAVKLLKGVVEVVATPSSSGKGQNISRCPHCKVALWSNYAAAGEAMRFIRIGTLDEPEQVKPDIHIYTSSKQDWVQIPADVRSMPAFYRLPEVWSAESLERHSRVR